MFCETFHKTSRLGIGLRKEGNDMGILYDLLEGKIERPGVNVVNTNNGKAIVFENQNVIESLDSETLEELSEWDGPTFELDE